MLDKSLKTKFRKLSRLFFLSEDLGGRTLLSHTKTNPVKTNAAFFLSIILDGRAAREAQLLASTTVPRFKDLNSFSNLHVEILRARLKHTLCCPVLVLALKVLRSLKPSSSRKGSTFDGLKLYPILLNNQSWKCNLVL